MIPVREETLAERLAASLDRQADMARLITKLYARLEDERILLNSALHQLADATKEPGQSHAAFISRWHAKHRRGL